MERHNGILASMTEKIKADMNLGYEIALSWALQAKNSLMNIQGFSPNQLVFGKNPKVPQISTNKEGSLREKTPSTIVREMLNTLQKAREEYIAAENNNRLKRAIKCKVENSPCTLFKTDDEVYFRRKVDNQWIGPVKVVGQMGKTVVIQHGGQIIKAHCTCVKLKHPAEQGRERNVESKGNTCDKDGTKKTIIETETVNVSESSSSDEEQSVEEVVRVEPVMGSEEEDGDVFEEAIGDQNVEVSRADENSNWSKVKVTKGKMSIKDGDKIRYKLNEDDEYKEVVIGSRSGKASGEFKNRFNVVSKDDGEYRLDLGKTHAVEKSDIVIQSAVVDDVVTETDEVDQTEQMTYYGDFMYIVEDNIWAVMVPKNRFAEPEIVAAMNEELNTLLGFTTYEEVKDVGQKCLSMRWIITEKPSSGGKLKYKARLVCRGFEEEDTDYEIDSPTVEKTSVRVFLTLCSTMRWNINSMDIKAAFLQSEKIDRTVFVRPPKSIKKTGIIWLLLKPLYGLSDSCRNWYFTLRKTLLEIGLTMSSFDKAVFYLKTNKLEGVVIIHVDDMLFSGNGKFLKLMKEVSNRFKLSRTESGSCRYIGLDITGCANGIQLTQKDYCNLVKPVIMTSERKLQLEDNVSKEELRDYQSLLGKLNWLSCNSRPDLKFDVFWFSLFNKSPTVQHLLMLNKVAQRVDRGSSCIVFPRLEMKQLRLMMYSDASLGNIDNKIKSCKAYIVFLADDENCSVLSWNCKKIDRVCTSTLEAETRAMKFGVTHALAIRTMLKEILDFDISIHCYIDSKQLEKACFSTKNVSCPVLRRDVALLQQWMQKGDITKVLHVRSAEQLADVMTKKGVNPLKLSTVLETGKLPKDLPF